MSRFWRVDKALEDSEGLRWIRERLGAYDWSKADWVSVRRGRSEKYAFRGVCKTPSERRRVPDQLQREQARHVPDIPIHARITLVSQPRRDVARSARRS